jgi:hypothetical protein
LGFRPNNKAYQAYVIIGKMINEPIRDGHCLEKNSFTIHLAVVVDFWAPLRAMQIVANLVLAKNMLGIIDSKVNTDENSQWAIQCGVYSNDVVIAGGKSSTGR